MPTNYVPLDGEYFFLYPRKWDTTESLLGRAWFIQNMHRDEFVFAARVYSTFLVLSCRVIK